MTKQHFQYYRLKFYLVLFGFITSIITYSYPQTAHAISNPLSVPNNIFGMHIAETQDLDEVRNLVNSQGGDWGYVTLVIQQTERNKDKWQSVFNKMRRLHLIPIVRIATRPQGDIWEKPSFGDIGGWVNFLDSLNWVIKNRYIIIGNEPNHSKEWGGEINPEEYSDYLKAFSQALKDASKDFFVLQSGFDASAPDSNNTMDEINFINRMLLKNPDIFQYIDGWDSHSYPNPNFSGSVNDTGRGTIKTFQWEIDLLKVLGVNKDLPIFITETGWVHGKDTAEIAKNYKFAFQNIWSNKRIVAVTPFIFNYQDKPFDIFSWKRPDGTFYDLYDHVKNLPKVSGVPIQIFSGRILIGLIPQIPKSDNTIPFSLITLNTGQSIWTKENIKISSNVLDFIQVKSLLPNEVNPGEIGLIAGTGNLSKIRKIYPRGYLQLSGGQNSFSNKYHFDILETSQSNPFNILTTTINNFEYFIYNLLQKGIKSQD